MRTREDLIKAAQGVCDKNSYLNCQLFTQLTTKTSDILKLPQVSVDDIRVGDILVWGRETQNDVPRHYNIYLGDGEVLDLPEWGGGMSIIPLKDVMDEYEGMEAFRPNLLESFREFVNKTSIKT